jgi:RHS repeat-associated protein
VLGNLTALTSGATQQYQYDALNRLRRVDNASLQRIDAWTYDGTGNRLSRQAGQGPVLPLTYPPTSHRVSVAGVARSYDANGNTTARGSENLFYGDHNRLVSWSGAFGMSSASYQHNARGERVWKQSMAGAASMGGNKLPPECLAVQGLILQSFLYDEAGRVIVDRNDPCSDGPLTNYEFVWLDDQPLAVIDADPNLPAPQLVGHVTSDHLHTPRAISNASGTVTWTWAPVSGNSTNGGSNVFGDRPAQATGAPFNTRPFNLRFPGQYLDAESGLHYNYFRDYEPGTGRYVQSDPIGLNGGISTYGYALQNPGRFVDPTGEAAALAALCFIPGIGQVSCAAAAAGTAVAGGLCYVTGTCQAMTNRLRDVVQPRDEANCEEEGVDDCKDVASDWELKQAGIDAHAEKKGLGSIRLFEICKCKSGGFAVKRKGCQGPIIYRL